MLLIGLALVGGVVLGLCTPWGLGISPDSAVYIGAARSLLRGQGVSLPTDEGAFAPIVHYPPLYPALLAVSGFVGTDAIAFARWLNVLLFSVNILLSGIIVFASTASLRFGVTAATLAATAFPVVLVHSMVWSEPLFVFFELCGIFLLLVYSWRSDARTLIAAALFIGLSVLSRYAGLALVISGTLGISFIATSRWTRRLTDAAIFLAVSSLPFVLWGLRNHWIAGSATNRQIGFHPAGFPWLSDVAGTVLSWFSGFSYASSSLLSFTLGALLTTAGLVFSPSGASAQNGDVETLRKDILLWLTALIIGVYLLLLYLSISFLDAQIPIDSRILSPLYAPFTLFALSLFHSLTCGAWAVGGRRLVFPAVVFAILSLQLAATLHWLSQLRSDGIGYSNRSWVESDLIKQVELFGRAAWIVSNAPDVVYTLAGRPAAMIPRKVYPDTRKPNPDYDSQIQTMKNNLKAKKGFVVYFDRVRWRWYLPSAHELEEAAGLHPLRRTRDGSIYRVD
jgi:hypothetical protein